MFLAETPTKAIPRGLQGLGDLPSGSKTRLSPVTSVKPSIGAVLATDQHVVFQSGLKARATIECCGNVYVKQVITSFLDKSKINAPIFVHPIDKFSRNGL